MIYLILKIFFYLLLAVLLGFAAGWLTRNILATKREEELNRSVTDARARVPQFESLMRTRDEQVQRLRDEIAERDSRLADLSVQVQAKEEELRSKNRELSKLSSRSANLSAAGDEAQDDYLGGELVDLPGAEPLSAPAADDAEAARLQGEVERLSRELNEARVEAADAMAEAANAEARLAALRADGASDGGAGADGNVQELTARVRQQAEEHERLTRALETEQRKVVELERERELQNKSLQVLHQQLELERERGNAAPPAGSAEAERIARH